MMTNGNIHVAAAPPDPADLCYVVSYDHGGLVLWGYDHFVRHLRELLAWLDRHPRLKMGLDNEAWMYDWLAENQPAVLAEICRALAKYPGRLGIATCTYGQPLANYLLDESNIRQIALGIETTRERLGYEVTVYAFSEHAAFPQIPQIARGLGLRGVLMRTHYLMYGHCPGYDVPIAEWQAPDGTRIPCVPTYQHQERQVSEHRAHPPGPYGLTTEDTWILTRYPSRESPAPLDAFRERFAQIRPLLATRLDDSGLKREALVEELDTRPEYRWATLEDVFENFPAPTTVIAPTAEEFGTRMPWGYRGNELFDLARRAEVMALTAERLLARATQGSVSGVGTGEQTLRRAWKNLLVGQHHDVQIVSRSGAFGRERLLAGLQATQDLARRLLTDEVRPDSGSEGDFTAFNPLPWPRTEASAELPDGTWVPGPASAPSLGRGVFRSPPEDETRLPLAFETEAYQVEFDPAGSLVRLDRRVGGPVLRAGVPSGGLAGVIEGADCAGAGTVEVTWSQAGFHVHERGKVGPLPYTVRWLFPHQGERIDYRVSVRFDGERIGAPTTERNDSRSCFVHEQKLRARFFPAVDAEQAVGIHDVPFGVSTTPRPYVEGNYWTALGDSHGGLAIANRGTMGSVREADGAFSIPLAFSTNYVWGAEVICGQREWAMGLLPWVGDWRDAGLHRRALEFAFPLVAVPGMPTGGAEDFLRVDDPQLHLTALYPGDGSIYARFYNGSDVARSLRWEEWGLPAPSVVDLRHDEIGPAPAPLELRPWQIVTLRLVT